MPSMEISEREKEVLDLLYRGLSNRQIAEKLIITEGTAKCHVKNIFQKLEVSSRLELIVKHIDVLLKQIEKLKDELREVGAEKQILEEGAALLKQIEEQSNASD